MIGLQKKSIHCGISIPLKGSGLSYPSLPDITTPSEVPSNVPTYGSEGSFGRYVP